MNRAEDGAATVLAISLVALLTVVAFTAAGMTGLVAAHRRAQAAADLSALAAAATLQEGGSGCAAAARVADRNGAELVGCSQEGRTVLVGVVVRTRPIGGQRWALPGRARAGPAEDRGAG